MKMAVTGPRPNKLYGYNEKHPGHKKLKDKIKSILIEYKVEEAVTGMAIGVDMIFAIAVIELKNEGYDIRLHCAIPHRNHTAKWDRRSKQVYDYVLKHADIVKLVSDEDYKPWLLQKRNEYIVDIVDKLLAVWNKSNTKGGTVNCIKYAKKCKRDIIFIDPFNLDEDDDTTNIHIKGDNKIMNPLVWLFILIALLFFDLLWISTISITAMVLAVTSNIICLVIVCVLLRIFFEKDTDDDGDDDI